jgi:hypothetical protein
MRLRRNQLCPIHRSLVCCGREDAPKFVEPRQLGVRRIEDQHHPRGYRELRSNAEMRKLLNRKIVSQTGSARCAAVNSQIMATWCRITLTLVEWEGPGETIIRTTFRLSTGGATEKRD